MNVNTPRLVRNARAICAVETDEELASHSRGLILMLADALEAADSFIELVAEARDWNHMRGWEDNCKCPICKGLVAYRSVVKRK